MVTGGLLRGLRQMATYPKDIQDYTMGPTRPRKISEDSALVTSFCTLLYI